MGQKLEETVLGSSCHCLWRYSESIERLSRITGYVVRCDVTFLANHIAGDNDFKTKLRTYTKLFSGTPTPDSAWVIFLTLCIRVQKYALSSVLLLLVVFAFYFFFSQFSGIENSRCPSSHLPWNPAYQRHCPWEQTLSTCRCQNLSSLLAESAPGAPPRTSLHVGQTSCNTVRHLFCTASWYRLHGLRMVELQLYWIGWGCICCPST